jgi:hypothetical protein
LVIAEQHLIDTTLGTAKPNSAQRLLAESISPQAIALRATLAGTACIVRLRGEPLAEYTHKSIHIARKKHLLPVFIASNWDALKPLCEHFIDLQAPVIFPIHDTANLFVPPRPTHIPQMHAPSSTRVPSQLVAKSLLAPALPKNLRQRLTKLLRALEICESRPRSDDKEERLLVSFARNYLKDMGLDASHARVPQHIRTIERGGLGAKRDHFFHSFQNFFLGLPIVLQMRSIFENAHKSCRVNWITESSDVWFLTAIWHDVGYAHQHIGKMLTATYGACLDNSDEVPINWNELVLESPATKEALRNVASLTARLAWIDHATTEWMSPTPKARLSDGAEQVRSAMQKNIQNSHGSFSAVRLFTDHQGDIDHLDPAKADPLRQATLIACASMQFHDQFFRDEFFRQTNGHKPSTCRMPFAALLAFVDSIQDDRRDLFGIALEHKILCDIQLVDATTYRAELDASAIPQEIILQRMVEARHVLQSFQWPYGNLSLKYPDWMLKNTLDTR